MKYNPSRNKYKTKRQLVPKLPLHLSSWSRCLTSGQYTQPNQKYPKQKKTKNGQAVPESKIASISSVRPISSKNFIKNYY